MDNQLFNVTDPRACCNNLLVAKHVAKDCMWYLKDRNSQEERFGRQDLPRSWKASPWRHVKKTWGGKPPRRWREMQLGRLWTFLQWCEYLCFVSYFGCRGMGKLLARKFCVVRHVSHAQMRHSRLVFMHDCWSDWKHPRNFQKEYWCVTYAENKTTFEISSVDKYSYIHVLEYHLIRADKLQVLACCIFSWSLWRFKFIFEGPRYIFCHFERWIKEKRMSACFSNVDIRFVFGIDIEEKKTEFILKGFNYIWTDEK